MASSARRTQSMPAMRIKQSSSLLFPKTSRMNTIPESTEMTSFSSVPSFESIPSCALEMEPSMQGNSTEKLTGSTNFKKLKLFAIFGLVTGILILGIITIIKVEGIGKKVSESLETTTPLLTTNGTTTPMMNKVKHVTTQVVPTTEPPQLLTPTMNNVSTHIKGPLSTVAKAKEHVYSTADAKKINAVISVKIIPTNVTKKLDYWR